MTPLTDLQKSIQAAEDREDLPFCADWQAISISILVSRCLDHDIFPANPRKYVHRDIRIAVLSKVFQAKPDWFFSSKLMSHVGAGRLLEMAYGDRRTRYQTAKTHPIDPNVIQAIQEAAGSCFEAKYQDGKVIRKESLRQLKHRLEQIDGELPIGNKECSHG